MKEKTGYYGEFGGRFVPETLMAALYELDSEYHRLKDDPGFKTELNSYLTEFAGREKPLTFCRNMSEFCGCKVYLKREDLVHGGAHKLKNTLGQALLCEGDGKKAPDCRDRSRTARRCDSNCGSRAQSARRSVHG